MLLEFIFTPAIGVTCGDTFTPISNFVGVATLLVCIPPEVVVIVVLFPDRVVLTPPASVFAFRGVLLWLLLPLNDEGGGDMLFPGGGEILVGSNMRGESEARADDDTMVTSSLLGDGKTTASAVVRVDLCPGDVASLL